MLRVRARRAGWMGASLAAAIALGHPRAASAQGAGRDANDRQARAEFTAGSEAFGRGDFEEAVRRFEAAYQLSQRALLLYNIGTSYDRLHRWRPARDAFARYLGEVPAAPNRDEVRARLRVIEATIAREDELAAQQAQRPVVVVREVPAVPVAPLPPPDARTWRTVGFVGLGLTGIAGALSLAVGALTNDHYDRLRTTCGLEPGGCGEAVIEDVALRASLTNVAIGATVVLAVGTAVAFGLDAARPREAHAARPAVPAVTVAPSAGGGGAGVSVVGSF